MHTRKHKQSSDPLAPDAVERFLDRHGLVRLAAAGAAVSVTFGLVLVAAVVVLGGLWVTAEVVAPSVPNAILGVEPEPTHTERIAPAAKTVPAAPAGQVVAGEHVPSAAASASRATGGAPAAPGAPWASILAPSAPAPGTPPLLPTPAPVAAPAVQPTVTPAASSSEPTPAASTSTAATTTIEPAPAPSPSASSAPPPSPTPSTDGRHCPRRHHRRC